MYEGALVAESLRPGVSLDELRLVVQAVHRVTPSDVTLDQPSVWTLLEYQLADADVDHLVAVLAAALDQPGWYADLRSPEETVVSTRPGLPVCRGDLRARAAAIDHGRTLGIPDSQLDWPV